VHTGPQAGGGVEVRHLLANGVGARGVGDEPSYPVSHWRIAEDVIHLSILITEAHIGKEIRSKRESGSVEMTGDKVIRRDFFKLWYFLRAPVHHNRTSWVEAATLRWVQW
jgi:hypothetical protein